VCLRPYITLLIILNLSGCVALTAVSAVPGALVEVITNQFVGQEVSVAYSMRRTIASIQTSLRAMNLDIDILENQEEGGYAIGFGNGPLSGNISLRKQTERLTTIYIKVRAQTREESVETAIITLVSKNLKNLPNGVHFDKKHYGSLREKPSAASARVAWYRQGASLEQLSYGNKDWVKIKMPSGQAAFLQASLLK